jgi:pre-mRNA-processing factor 39
LTSPFSIQSTNKIKLAEDGNESTTHRRMVLENGHPGLEINEAAIRKGENPYTKYYQQQGETPVGPGSNAKGSNPTRHV